MENKQIDELTNDALWELFPDNDAKKIMLNQLFNQNIMQDKDVTKLVVTLASLYKYLIDNLAQNGYSIHSDILKDYQEQMETINKKLFGSYDTKLNEESIKIKKLVSDLSDKVNQVAVAYEEHYKINRDKLADNITARLTPALSVVSDKLVSDLRNVNKELISTVNNYQKKINEINNVDIATLIKNSCTSEINNINKEYKEELSGFLNTILFGKKVISFLGGFVIGSLIIGISCFSLWISQAEKDVVETTELIEIKNAAYQYLENDRGLDREETRANLENLIKKYR